MTKYASVICTPVTLLRVQPLPWELDNEGGSEEVNHWLLWPEVSLQLSLGPNSASRHEKMKNEIFLSWEWYFTIYNVKETNNPNNKNKSLTKNVRKKSINGSYIFCFSNTFPLGLLQCCIPINELTLKKIITEWIYVLLSLFDKSNSNISIFGL